MILMADVTPELHAHLVSATGARGGSPYRAVTCSADELVLLAAEMQGAAEQSAFSSPCWLGPLVETPGT